MFSSSLENVVAISLAFSGYDLHSILAITNRGIFSSSIGGALTGTPCMPMEERKIAL